MADKHSVLIALGNRIREVRSGQGYSQEGFAAKVGIDRAYYGGVERGERNISSLNLVRIALALNTNVGDLFPEIDALKTLFDDQEKHTK